MEIIIYGVDQGNNIVHKITALHIRSFIARLNKIIRVPGMNGGWFDCVVTALAQDDEGKDRRKGGCRNLH